MESFKELFTESKKAFKEGQKIQYNHNGKFIKVEVDQVLRNGNARFYIGSEELEVQPEDTHLYKLINEGKGSGAHLSLYAEDLDEVMAELEKKKNLVSLTNNIKKLEDKIEIYLVSSDNYPSSFKKFKNFMKKFDDGDAI